VGPAKNVLAACAFAVISMVPLVVSGDGDELNHEGTVMVKLLMLFAKLDSNTNEPAISVIIMLAPATSVLPIGALAVTPVSTCPFVRPRESKSLSASVLKVGCAGEPLKGPAQKERATWVCFVIVNPPEGSTKGDPETENSAEGALRVRLNGAAPKFPAPSIK